MDKEGKKFKYKKVNTLTEFERQKLYKDNKKNEQKITESKKLFGKLRIRKVVSLRNILSPLSRKEMIKPRKSKNIPTFLSQRRKTCFDTTKPVYSANRQDLFTLKTTNCKNGLNTNIIREMNKVNKISNNDKFKTLIRTDAIKSRKILLYKQYNNGIGFDKHVMTSKSMPDIAYETKYTSDIKNYKSKELNEEQKNQFYYLNNFNNTSNKFKEKQSILSTLEYSNFRKIKEQKLKKYKFSRENIINNFSEIYKHSFKMINRKYLNQKKKYHFIKNSNLLDIDNFENLKKEVEKFNKNSLVILKKENAKLFAHPGSIIEKTKFSIKYRDPLNNSFDKELEEERKIKEKNNIKIDILPGVNLMKEIDEEIDKRKIVKKVINVKSLWSKVKRIIIRKMVYLKHIQISLFDILNSYKMSKSAFTYPQTEHLLMAIRNKKYDICCDILDRYKHIVLDFDYFHLTPLHWAAKLNFFEIIPKLIAYGAFVNEQNLWGNTPLHISLTQNYYETSIFLLLYLASPFIKNNNKKKPFDCTNNIQFNIISKKIINIHLRNIISRQKNYYENVQKEFSNYIIFEFSNLLNPVALSLIKDLKSNYL